MENTNLTEKATIVPVVKEIRSILDTARSNVARQDVYKRQKQSWHNTNPSVVSSAQQIWNRKIAASAPKSAAMKAPSNATIYGIFSIRNAIKPTIGTMPTKSRVELQKLHFVQRERFKRCPDRLDAPHLEIAHFLQV